MNYTLDSAVDVLLTIAIIFFTVAFLSALISKILNFNRELGFLNREIQRTEGEECEHWKQERRRLWLSLLPFFPK